MMRVVGAAVVGLLSAVAPAQAQDFEGRVVDATNGAPIAGALVEIRGPRLVTLTDEEGRFSFPRIDVEVDSVVVSRFGYATMRIQVDFAAVGTPDWELVPDPVELEELTVQYGFEERYEVLDASLDARIGRWPGQARVAGRDDLRPFDEAWRRDPWEFLHHGPLKVSWHFNDSVADQEDPVYIRGYGRAVPEVYIDDRQVWLQLLIETPNEQLCRAEIYVPERFTLEIQPPSQIRAYTCSFLGRVAMGLEEICSRLQWGGLLSGPAGPPSLRASPSGRDRRPSGTPTPIDLGPGLDLSAATIGVGSGAC